MIGFEGRLFPPGSASFVLVSVTIDANGRMTVCDMRGDLLITLPWRDCEVSDRVSNTPRRIMLPDHRVIETAGNAAVDAAEKAARRASMSRWLAILERRRDLIAITLVLAVLCAWGLVRYGLPAGAAAIAYSLPRDTLAAAGDEALKALRGKWLGPSRLGEQDRERLRTLFASALDRSAPESPCCKLEFNTGKLLVGANALAFPNGVVVITDQMVEIAPSDAALVGVFVHEIAHVKERHALRRLIESSVVSAAILAITGDLSGISELLVALPVVVLQASHSREFERAADAEAIRVMLELGLDPARLAELFEEIGKTCTGISCGGGWLSSHPSNTERIEYFRNPGRP